MGPIGVALTVIGISLLTTSGMSSLTSHFKEREKDDRKKADEAEKKRKGTAKREGFLINNDMGEAISSLICDQI